MTITTKSALTIALATTLGLGLAACSSGPKGTNQTLYSVNQPVVEHSNYTLDLDTGAGGLTIAEQRRLDAWFETMDLKYGDRVYLDDPVGSGSTLEDVAEIAGRRGILVSAGAPVTPGYVDPGTTRVVISRARAYVPGCPDWSANGQGNYGNATSPGYGCSVNGNMAAMIANPDDLLMGQEGTGETVIQTSTKAINSYRNQTPTGEGGLSSVSSSEGGS